MKIGIDIDDTVSKSNELLVEEALRFDGEYLNDRGFKNKEAYSFREMLYWTEDDVIAFLDHIRGSNLLLSTEPIEDSIKYINKLYEEGNEIYFITKRDNRIRMKNMTKKWLKKYNYKYHKVYFNIKDKAEFVKKNNIDILIDNDVPTAKKCLELKQDYILKQDGYNYKNEGYNMIDKWTDIYKYIEKKVK